MTVPVAYDITRLATRVLQKTPNGIDRIDFAFARHFIGQAQPACSGVMLTLRGPRVLPAAGARDIVAGIAAHWREDETPERDDAYRRVVAWLGGDGLHLAATQRVARERAGRMRDITRWIRRHGLPAGRPPVETLPKGAIYLNVSQFPLWVARYFRWIERRPDVKSVFFIHDLLPIEFPEYFRKAEYERHQTRLKNLAKFAAGAIVTTDVVRKALAGRLASLGRGDLPILVAPIPAAPIFSRREAVDPRLLRHRYFVACGTIEPRKNHLLLLHVWRELVRRDGAAAPKLVLVGSRGWENENVVDLLERCRTIGNHVVEVAGLSTPSFKRLLDGACALLMPSFAEGYGLPLVEALAANVPVIASDLDVFRETGGEHITTISPIDGEKWLDTIRAFARADPPYSRAGLSGDQNPDETNWQNYFATIDNFLASLK